MKWSLVITILFSSALSWGQVTFQPLNVKQVEVGDFFQARIYCADCSLPELLQQPKGDFVKHFAIMGEINDSNQVDLTLLYVKPLKKEVLEVRLQETLFEIKIDQFEIFETELASENSQLAFFDFLASRNWKSWWYHNWYWFLLLAFILVSLYWKFLYPQSMRRRELQLREKKKQDLISYLQPISDRKGLESIFRYKNVLLQQYHTPALKIFFKKIEKIQYKQQWQEEELQELLDCKKRFIKEMDSGV